MILVERVILREIHLTLKEPFTISSGTQTRRRILLVELVDADGVRGWSECVAGELPNYLPETIDTAWLALSDWIVPRILKVTFERPKEIHPILEKDIRGHTMAKAAIEMAAWELAARKQGVSLSSLLGGTQKQVATGISIGIQPSPDELVERAIRSLAEGYRKIKLKIKPGSDLEYVKAIREALEPDAPIMVDANCAYNLDHLEILYELDTLGLLMIEQPFAWDDQVRHAELQKRLKTPICLDESITRLDHAEDMIALDSGRIVNIKPGRVGGFVSAMAIHDLCMEHGIPVWCGGMLESGIGRAHNVALASLPNFTMPGDISPSSRYWERDIVTPEWAMSREGLVDVPVDRPGLGVDIDLDHIEDITVRKQAIGGRSSDAHR